MQLAILTVLSIMLFSCKGEEQAPQTTSLSPLETVRELAKENEQYTKIKQTDDMPYPPEIEAIHERGYIVFSMVAQDQKPFFYNDEQTGELIGLDVEIGYAIANALRVTAVFNRNASTYDEVIMKVANGEADIALSDLSITMQRAELVRYTKPYLVLRQALLINRLEFAKIGLEDKLPEFIRNYRGTIGVEDGTSYMSYARTNFPNADIKGFQNASKAIEALIVGSVLAVYMDECEILINKRCIKDATILMKLVFISDKSDYIAMAVSADAPMLHNWLNVFIDGYISQNRHELNVRKLIERHIGAGK
jgi:ABC-type amino acid transport substrate-binding protein